MEVATFGGEKTLCRPGACCDTRIVKPSGAIVQNINIIHVVLAECLGLARGVQENSGFVTDCALPPFVVVVVVFTVVV